MYMSGLVLARSGVDRVRLVDVRREGAAARLRGDRRLPGGPHRAQRVPPVLRAQGHHRPTDDDA